MHNLRAQMKDMSQDFEDMKNARIASKQLLDQRFTNVYTYVLSRSSLARFNRGPAEKFRRIAKQRLKLCLRYTRR